MNKLFKLKENSTTVSTEVRAGLTTFFAMAYIIFVNPVFLSATGMDADGAMIATCLGAAIGTLMCAFMSNKPFALAPGMGMNAYFAYTLCFGYGYSWQQSLALVFIAGLLFLLAVIILRDKVVYLIPSNLKHAITAGIGFLITLIGLVDAGLIDFSTGVPALASLKNAAAMVAVIGLFITIILTVLRVPGSLILGMIATFIVSLVLGQSALPSQVVVMPTAISKVFLKLSFTGLLQGKDLVHGLASVAAILVTMTIIDMFDTLGYLMGTASRAGLMDKDGKIKDIDKVMISDAGATVLGSLCGTSTVTCYAESTSGIVAGGRTGLTGLTAAACFLLAMFFSPLAGMLSAAVTAPALIVVGMYLMMDISKIKLDAIEDAIPALLTVIAIPITYSITTGMGIGFLSFFVCEIFRKDKKPMSAGTVVLAAIFLVYFIL